MLLEGVVGVSLRMNWVCEQLGGCIFTQSNSLLWCGNFYKFIALIRRAVESESWGNGAELNGREARDNWPRNS
jgi:hypothetical protein